MSTTPNSVVSPQTPNAPICNVLLSTAMTNTKAYEGTDTAGTALAQFFLFNNAGSTAGSKTPDFATILFASTTGATPSGTTNATVVRFFLNNGGLNTTASNNIFLGEVAIPSISYSQTVQQPSFRFPLGFSAPAGYKLYAGLSTAVGGTNAALAVNAAGGGDF